MLPRLLMPSSVALPVPESRRAAGSCASCGGHRPDDEETSQQPKGDVTSGCRSIQGRQRGSALIYHSSLSSLGSSVSVPNKPCCSSSMPAAKNNVVAKPSFV